MSAKVTREHRETARDVLYFDDAMLRRWVETGKSQDAGRANRVAQAIADAEARGAASAAALSEAERLVLEIVVEDYGATEGRQAELWDALEKLRALRAAKKGGE